MGTLASEAFGAVVTVLESTTARSAYIETALRQVPGVSVVEVRERRDGSIHATVFMSQFDRDSRRAVYAAEGRLMDEFPQARIDVDVVDASMGGHHDDSLLEG